MEIRHTEFGKIQNILKLKRKPGSLTLIRAEFSDGQTRVVSGGKCKGITQGVRAR